MAFWDSMGGGMFASAGSTFLNTLAGSHAATIADRTLRPYQDFDTPWGKGPYWDAATMAAAQKLGIETDWDTRMAKAKEYKIHPLFALGGSPGYSPSFSGEPRRGSGSNSAAVHGASIPMLMGAAAAAEKDHAMADYYRSLAEAARQGRGGAPAVNSDGSIVTPLPPAKRTWKRPLDSPPPAGVRTEPHVVAPHMIELVREDGSKLYIYHPSAQADELNQLLIAAQDGLYGVEKMARAANLDFIWNAGRQAYELVKRVRQGPKGVARPPARWRKRRFGRELR